MIFDHADRRLSTRPVRECLRRTARRAARRDNCRLRQQPGFTPNQNWVARRSRVAQYVAVRPDGYTDEFAACSATVAEDRCWSCPIAIPADSAISVRLFDLCRQLAEQRGDQDITPCCFGRSRARFMTSAQTARAADQPAAGYMATFSTQINTHAEGDATVQRWN